MKKLFVFILCVSLPSYIFPCTTFFINDGDTKIFGRNYDFQIGKGLLILNKNGLAKESPKDKNGNSIKWNSEFGSVTFNQFGREYPMGGMNEAGLVIELMWMDGTEYPEPDSRPAVNTLLWIQYQLDNFSSVQEVIDSDSKIRISKSSVPIHYLIADKNGNSATIEFIGGKMVYHMNSDLKFKVLANDFYSSSLDYIGKYKDFGGNEELVSNQSSLNRFARTCKLIKSYNSKVNQNPVDFSFDVLDKISQQGWTQWSIIYDLSNSKIYFRTKESSKIKNIEFKDLDFSCTSNAKIFDLSSDIEGNINTALSDYSASINYDLVKYSFTNVDFLKGTSEETIKSFSLYPESFHCSK
ncbi:MAG: linear amide C-N hydrolase [Bacteroidetes bacterium]|nr:linear amide C-N hydrolase [Bacteroidota bacterium]